MKILAVDTSSKNCSISIAEVDEDNNFKIIISENNNDEKTHSQKLMPMIDDMFKKTNLSLNDINLLACCLGPGSFTGIRIGIATIKAFADAKNIPTVGVTSLESLAYNENTKGFVCPIIDCKNNNVYSSLFFYDNNTYSQIGDNIAENINTALDIFLKNLKSSEMFSISNLITFVGDGSILHKDLVQAKFSNYNIKLSDNNIQSSISLAKCAYHKYLNGLYGDSNSVSPLYLRKSQAERAQNGEK